MDKLSNEKMEKNTFLWALLWIVIISGYVNATRVGIFVDFPDGSKYLKCVEVEENTNAYEILQKTDLNISWSPPSQWGHGLCMINTVGCPSDNCYCSSSYWNFYIKKLDENSLNYSPVGFDGGSECWNRDYSSFDGHYCAVDGDVLGFGYGSYGTMPKGVDIESICRMSHLSERGKRYILVSTTPERIYVEEQVTMKVLDNSSLDPIKDAEIIIYPTDSDASLKIFEGTTNKKGTVSFSINKSGKYKVLVATSGYPHKYENLNVSNKEKIQSVSTSTSTITESTITTTITESTSTINIEEIKEEIKKLEEFKGKANLTENKSIEITGHVINVKTTDEGIFRKYWILLLIVLIVVPFLLWVSRW